MILLTDEEMGKVMGLPYPPEEDLEHENYAVVDIQDLHPLAKAQLKKVVDEMEKHFEYVDASLRGGSRGFFFSGKEWQALLEEVE